MSLDKVSIYGIKFEGIQCHWSFVGDILGYLKKFDNFCIDTSLENLTSNLNVLRGSGQSMCLWQGQ